jgi:SAM-dependent methyltransferase
MYRLVLAVCDTCRLLQLAGDGPEEIDDPSAPPPTSSATIARHARQLVSELVGLGLASPGGRVLEMASHRGYLHPFFAEAGVETTVLATTASEAERLVAAGTRVVTLEDGEGRADDLGQYDLIVDHYLLSHLQRPRAALAAVAEALVPGGRLVIETDHVLSIVEGCQFDAIRHGHRSYLGLQWLLDEFDAAGLGVEAASIQPVYGGALRVRAHREPARASQDLPEDVRAILAREDRAGVATREGLADFAARVDRVRATVRTFLESSRANRHRVIGYGAPARAVTFLNALGIGPDLLSVTADRAESKQGRAIPGVGLPIVAPDELRSLLPADVLVLAWDLAEEIRAAMPWVEEDGGRWLVAVPELAVVRPGFRVPLSV